jgi:hypothetical protein
MDGKKATMNSIIPIPFDSTQSALTTIGLWVVEVNGHHPLWSKWLVGLIHLREQKGASPAVKDFPDATHEVMAWALNPQHYAELEAAMPNIKPPYPVLTPVDIVQQFVAMSDTAAIERVEAALKLVVEDKMSLDSDYRSMWKEWANVDHVHSGREQQSGRLH